MEGEFQLEAPAIRHFMLAGNATFTLVSTRTGARYTYRVRRAYDQKDDELPRWFVSLLTGPDNESSYTYIGMIFADQAGKTSFRLTRASQLPITSTPVEVFEWVFGQLSDGLDVGEVEVWHAGMCGRCGRTLTVPESIASGLGPECRRMES
jgi:hypothetical protein